MTSFQIITTLITVTLLCLAVFFILKFIRARKKVPYQKLFEKEKRKVYLTRNNRFIGWLVFIFFLSIFSFVFLLRITLINSSVLLIVVFILLLANIILLKRKYRIKTSHDIAWLSLIIGMGQLSFFLWLNFVPLRYHYEEYRIIKYEKDAGMGLTTVTLQNNAYDDYWTLRSFEGKNVPHGDTIVYKFTDGLLGFKIYDSHSSH